LAEVVDKPTERAVRLGYLVDLERRRPRLRWSRLIQGCVPRVLRAQPRAPPPPREARVADPGGRAPWCPL